MFYEYFQRSDCSNIGGTFCYDISIDVMTLNSYYTFKGNQDIIHYDPSDFIQLRLKINK